MVMMYFDREANVEAQLRRDEGFAQRMPLLRAAMRKDAEANDATYQGAFKHWLADVIRRVSNKRPSRLKIPLELQFARGLDSQTVTLRTDDSVWGKIGNQDCLLYPITKTA